MFKFLRIPLLIITILILLGFIIWAYPLIKNRYFDNSESENKPSELILPIENNENKSVDVDPMSNPNRDTSENADLEKFLSGEKTATPESTSPININERNTSGKTLAHITTEHCDNGCQAFAMDFKLLEYCQQVCGIAPVKEVSNCDDKNNIEKDYCLKDLAIAKKDFSLCGPINDANVKLTCQNRITEDIIESQAN